MIDTLLLWKVSLSGISLLILQSIDLNVIFTTGLLDVLAVIFLLFGLLLFVFYLRKESTPHIRGNAGNAPRRFVGALSLVVLALPLLGLLLVWSNISASPTLIVQTPTPTPTHSTQKPTPTPTPTPTLDLLTQGTLTVGTDATYPPQEFLDKQKNPTGFDMDLIAAIAKKMGLKVSIASITPFTNLLPALNNNQMDVVISGVPITPDYQQQATFIPYLKSVESLMVPKNNPNRVTKLMDLCGKKVGVLKGSSSETDLNNTQAKCNANNQITIMSQGNTASIAQALQNNSIDVAYLDAPVANYYMNVQTYKGLFAVSGQVPETIQQGIAIRQSDMAMFQAVTQAFQAVRQDGMYKKLLDQWGFASESL